MGNDYSSKEIREIYNEIRGNSPQKLSDLRQGYEIEYTNSIDDGSFAKIFNLEKRMVGKVLKSKANSSLPMRGRRALEKVVKEYSIQKLSSEIELGVPVPYEIVEAYDKTTKGKYPMLLMEKINGKNVFDIFYGKNILDPEEEDFVVKSFENAVDNVMGYLTGNKRTNDLELYNTMFDLEKNKVRPIDCERWEFRALQNK